LDVNVHLGPSKNNETGKWGMCNNILASTDVDRTLVYAKFDQSLFISEHVWFGEIDETTPNYEILSKQIIFDLLLDKDDCLDTSSECKSRNALLKRDYKYFGLACAFRNQNTFKKSSSTVAPGKEGDQILSSSDNNQIACVIT